MATKKAKKKATKKKVTKKKEYFVAAKVNTSGSPEGYDGHFGNSAQDAANELEMCCGLDTYEHAMVYKIIPVGRVVAAQISVIPLDKNGN